MLLDSVYPTGRPTHGSRRAGETLQMFELAPWHGLRPRMLTLVLLEHRVGLRLDFPPYLPTTEPRLIVKPSVLRWPITRPMLLTFIRLRLLKFKQIACLDFNLAKALVLERTVVYYGDDEF